MWKDKGKKGRRSEGTIDNNRWRLVVAVIFILFGAIVYQLFCLQVAQSDYYASLASNQHNYYNLLIPERGKVYFSEKNDTLYPLAINKEYADVNVVPKDIEEPVEIAEKLYLFFDEPDLKKAYFKQNPEATKFEVATSTKEAIIEKYLKIVDKPGDPYEPLRDKMEIEEMLELFSFVGPNPDVSASDLIIKSGRLVFKENTNQVYRVPGFDFRLQSYRYYPEGKIASHIIGFTTQEEGESQGRYGLEEFFNRELSGTPGYLKTDRANNSNLMIINDREYVQPVAGSDLVLTIDRNIEYVICEKLEAMVRQYNASGGTVIVVQPQTGAIIAMCSVPSFDPNNYRAEKDISVFNNPAILYQYEPGSVFKAITLAIALDQGKITPSTTYEDTGQMMIKGWNKPISNSDYATFGAHGVVDMNSVLDNSLNTGAIFAMNQVGPQVFAEYVKGFGFGEKTGVELGAEGQGNISNLLRAKVRDIDAATASFGQGIATTPLQMLMSYQAIANQGLLMKPYVVKTIISPDGKEQNITPKPVAQVITEKTAATISAMLVNVVEKGHSQKAAIPGYYIGAKTGTGQIASAGGYLSNQFIHTFVGIAPIEDPAFVMLTKIDKPVGVKFAEGTALPLWHDIAEFILNYYGIPKHR